MHKMLYAEVKNRRHRGMRESDKDPDDYVMVSVTKNQANRPRHNKNMVKWQGLYEVTDGPSKFSVRLVGTTDVKDVHWQKMIHIGGPGLFVSQAVQNSDLTTYKGFW